MASLELIAHKLDEMQTKQETTARKVSEVREGMYDPEGGLFARIRDRETWAKDHEERDAELRKHVDTIAANMGPLTDDYKVRQSWKKWKDRIIWLLLSAALLAGLASAKKLFVDAENDRLDRIETLLKK